MIKKLKDSKQIILRYFKNQGYKNTALLLTVSMVFSIIPNFTSTVSASSLTTATQSLNMYNLSYISGTDTSGSDLRYYTSPIVSGTDNSPTITFPQSASGYDEGTVCSGGTVTSKYSMDFTRSFTIEGKASFATRDGIGVSLHTNPSKKAFSPNYSTCMMGVSYQSLYSTSTNFTLDNTVNDIDKGLLWEFMQISDNNVSNTRAYKGAYSYKINNLTNMTAFPDDNTSGYGAYGIKNSGTTNVDGAFTLTWNCTDSNTATGKLVMTMGGTNFTYSNLCAKDVFGTIDNAKSVYFTMSSWAPPYINSIDDKTKSSSITIDKAYYSDSTDTSASTFGVSTSYYIDSDNDGSYETPITGNKTVDPNQKVLVRNIITNLNKNATANISTALLLPNLSVSDGSVDTKINSISDQKFYWKEHNGVETLKTDMYQSIGSGPFNSTDSYSNFAKVTLPAGGDGTNIYDDAYAVYEYVVTPNSDSQSLKQTVQIGVSPFMPAVVDSSISFAKTSKALVTLNKPVFNNDKSGYSFKSATTSNFTGVNSITFSATKGTTVQYIPTFLVPTSKLESIDGDTRTFTYEFENSISVSQAEEFIHGIIFNYVAGAEVSITVDNNRTNLPDGAKITKFAHPDGTDHYYMYVPSDYIYWTQAYNLAKTYSYMGMKGYLTTVTSKEEDEALTNISTTSAWSAGTCYLNGASSMLNDSDSVSDLWETADYYYWACGPEKGTCFYNSTSSTPTPGANYTGYNGAYNNWGAIPAQPDASSTGECCMQVNWPYDEGANGQMRWNDLPNEGIPALGLVKGYFVEFSKYSGGMDSSYASDKTAVGTYNLATDGGVEEVATVTLNAPVYGSGNKSEFSFNNAELKNISTIYSLTVNLDNYTSVLSKPSSPAVTNELSNIAGSTNTITYQFENGITLTEAQSFLRGLNFRYGGLKSSSTTNVSITVDGNKTNLPTGASITEFNGHYYMYINDYLSWTDAYNKAKTYTYMGLVGYLATITSSKEDKTLDNISMNGAWSGGTRLTGSYDLATAPNGTSVNNPYFIWACGPEAGTKYYDQQNITPVNGAYNGFYDTNEPNGFINQSNAECCMQVHYKGDASSPMTWNDLSNRIYMGGTEPKVGYFVEFSDYDGGRVNGFIQSANGKSLVPITVEKGDVFNGVKDGGTYYVDTILKAFDRNITNITVNNNTFTSGSKLLGNKNTTYTIVATDLENNTATMTVTMKTIASISEPIKDLTVSNVQMNNIDSILAVKSTLKAIDTTDASDSQKAEITAAILNCNDLYFALFNATATPANGTNGWYKNGITNITLTAPEGFEISTSNTGAWTNSITVNKEDGTNKTTSYYLKQTVTGDISSAKTFTYKVDTVAPTGTITIKNNAFKNFINTISFGLFYKDSVDVTITGNDTLSTPVTISYQKVSSDESYQENGTWTTGSLFSETANQKFVVYARLTDNAGNVSIINSDGVVVYTDSTQDTANISFTKTSTVDVPATVHLNGNSINEIKNGTVTLISETDYTVSNTTITFKAGYLDSLAVGTYTFTVSYNPMCNNYVEDTNNQAPSTTTITLAVKAKNLSGEVGSDASASVTITPDTMVYSGNAFQATVTVKDGTNILNAGTDYTLGWTTDMTSVGEKTLTVTFKGNYTGTVTKKVSITNATIADTTAKIQTTTFNNTLQTIPTVPTGTTINQQPLTVKYTTNGVTYDLTSAPQFTSAGNYVVYYQLSAPNHNDMTGQILFTVNAANDNTIHNLALNGWSFGSTANTPTATATYGTPVYTYSVSENGTYTSTVPTQSGTYWVKASVAATADYNGCEAKTSFVISNKAIDSMDIAISGVNAYYLFTGSAITPTPTVTGNGTVLVKDIDYTVSYENNTEIGKSAKVKVVLKGNYSGNAEKTFEIKYGTATEDEIQDMITLPDYNSNGWHKANIVISAKGIFTLSTTPTGSFGNNLTISEESTKMGTDYTFYIKATDGSIYQRTMTYKLDKTAPTGSITINNNGFKNFINTISFGLFYKNSVDVTIEANDTLSGPQSISYQKVTVGGSYDENGTWINGSSFSVTSNEKFTVYAKLVDYAGNVTIINTEGVVVYTDSTQNTANISFTKTSTVDVPATVNLNGNTMNTIKNGSATLVNGTDYTISNGTITLKAGYLNSLAVGTYTLAVSYNPMGENYVEGTDNQVPATTTLTLAVKAKNLSGEIGSDASASVMITPDTMVYNGNTFDPTVLVKDGTKILVKDTDYTLSWPDDRINVGDKTLVVTFKGNYIGTITKKVSITNATIVDTTDKTQTTAFNNTLQTIAAVPTATTINNQPLTVKYSKDGNTYDLTTAPQFTSAGNYTVYYQLSAPNHNDMTSQILFTINAAKDNSIQNFTLNGWTFGSTPNIPAATATYGAPAFTYSDRENGTYTSTVPTKAGIYWVRASVDATADYNGCEAKLSFAISDKAINAKDIAISGIQESYLFTGSAITPEPTVTVNGTVLIKDADYTVTYENNTAIGKTAKVKVLLKGNYSGNTEKAFEIKYGTATEDEIKNMISIPDYHSNGWHKEDLVISANGNFALSTMPTGSFGNTLTISQETSKTGLDYTFYIKASDGSVYERTLTYLLDKTAPSGSITFGESGIKGFLNSISFGLLFNNDVTVTVSSDDTMSGIDTVQIYKAEKALTEEELSSVKWVNYTDAIKEVAKDTESFIYYARITDYAGNTVIVNSEGATFDLTPPVINGVTNGETYYTTQKLIVADASLKSVTVNGKDFEIGNTILGNTDETYTIVATDMAGNRTTYRIAMKPIYNISDNLSNLKIDDIKSEDQSKIYDIMKKAESVDTTNATAEEKAKIKEIIDQCNLLLNKIADNGKVITPETGDHNKRFAYLAVMFVSGGTLTIVFINRKRKKYFKK